MSNLHGAEDPRLFDLWTQLLRDGERGSLPALEHYLARFPGLEAEVAREYRAATARLARDGAPLGERESRASATASNAHATRQLLERLARHPPRLKRYEIEGEIGRGGMGVVHKAFDDDLRRSIAMKVARRNNERSTASFLDEAQITGQLDHPGIVPVHELGIDEHGAPFFTMKLVKGRTLADVFRLVEEGDKEWTKTRALNALLRVCEAMAYAHSKGVIHRDLKPTNVMCGAFGEVYVMDWGLARLLGSDSDGKRHPAPDREKSATGIHTTRADELESTPDSPLATQEGDVVGTPNYMPPEQAYGNRESLSARSDVYSAGAILYQLLSGRAPYAAVDQKTPQAQVLMRVLQGPPAALLSIRSGIPAELVAICQKAMARDPAERYPDMSAMAADLRAYLEQRVVSAYRVGAWQEFRKWCARNRTTAGLAGVAVILALGATFALWYAGKSRDEKLLAEQQTDLAEKEKLLADKDRLMAEERSRAANVLAIATNATSKEQAEPGTRADIMRSCLADDRSLELLSTELAVQASSLEFRHAASAEIQARLKQLAQDAVLWGLVPDTMRVNARNACEPNAKTFESHFAASAEEERAARTVSLVKSLAAHAPAAWEACLALAVSRLKRIQSERSAVAGTPFPKRDSRDDYDHLIRFVTRLAEFCDADPRIGVAPLFQSAFVASQEPALVPLGPDPRSGLLEFAHPRTGAVPTRLLDGRLDLNEHSSVVLVLVPAPSAAFLVAKQELTLGQWWRAGNLPAADAVGLWAGLSDAERKLALMLPVVNVSWREAALTLRRCGLELPSESQWEQTVERVDQDAGLTRARSLILSPDTATLLCVSARAAAGEEIGLGLRGLTVLPAEWTRDEWRALPVPSARPAVEVEWKRATLRVIRGLVSPGDGSAGALRLRTTASIDDRSLELGIRAVRPKVP